MCLMDDWTELAREYSAANEEERARIWNGLSPDEQQDFEECLKAGPTATEGFLLTIGDIGITQHWIVTPNGRAPVAGSQWIASDVSRVRYKTPAWAIIFAIIFFFFFLLGLLFLLAKEEEVSGYVEVTVRADGLFHMTQLPVTATHQVAQIRSLVSRAQALAAQPAH